eukprot:2837939-Rhodomonas_salina.1
MPIAAGETVTLSLPGFSGPSFQGFAVTVGINTTIANASWDGTNTTLTLQLTQPVGAGEVGEYVFPLSAGLRVPRLGIRVDQTDLTIATNAVSGPVPPTTFLDFPAVGILSVVRMSFNPPIAENTTALTLFFFSALRIDAGDVVLLTLPGFLAVDGATAPAGAGWTASWSAAASELSFTATANIPAKSDVIMVVARNSALQITLPSEHQ